MSAYRQITNFRRKDSLPTGAPDKAITGTELYEEFRAVQVALSSMAGTLYTPITNFAVKDALTTGNASKLVVGSLIDAEFNAIKAALYVLGTTYTRITTFANATGSVLGTILQNEFDAVRTAVQAAWAAGGGAAWGGGLNGPQGSSTSPAWAYGSAPSGILPTSLQNGVINLVAGTNTTGTILTSGYGSTYALGSITSQTFLLGGNVLGLYVERDTVPFTYRYMSLLLGHYTSIVTGIASLIIPGLGTFVPDTTNGVGTGYTTISGSYYSNNYPYLTRYLWQSNSPASPTPPTADFVNGQSYSITVTV